MTRRWAPLLAGMGFLALTVLVHRHVTDGLDRWAFHWFWPSGQWGRPQIAADVVVNLLQPAVTAVGFGLLALATRDRGVMLRAVGRIVVTTLVVVVLKHLIDRPDVHGSTAHLGGSYPSGHLVALLAYGEGALRLRGRGRWLLAPAAAVLALALLVTGTHWLTDVVAGALVGLVLATVGSPQVRGADEPDARARRHLRAGAGK